VDASGSWVDKKNSNLYRKTDRKDKTLNPNWSDSGAYVTVNVNEHASVHGFRAEVWYATSGHPPFRSELIFFRRDHDTIGSDDFLGFHQQDLNSFHSEVILPLVEVENTAALQARSGKKDKVKGTITFHVSFSSLQATENMKAKIDKEYKEAATAGASSDASNIPEDIKAMRTFFSHYQMKKVPCPNIEAIVSDEEKLKAALEAFHTATAGSCEKAHAVRLPAALNKCEGLEPFVRCAQTSEAMLQWPPNI
jgi:hypothetical protein